MQMFLERTSLMRYCLAKFIIDPSSVIRFPLRRKGVIAVWPESETRTVTMVTRDRWLMPPTLSRTFSLRSAEKARKWEEQTFLECLRLSTGIDLHYVPAEPVKDEILKMCQGLQYHGYQTTTILVGSDLAPVFGSQYKNGECFLNDTICVLTDEERPDHLRVLQPREVFVLAGQFNVGAYTAHVTDVEGGWRIDLTMAITNNRAVAYFDFDDPYWSKFPGGFYSKMGEPTDPPILDNADDYVVLPM